MTATLATDQASNKASGLRKLLISVVAILMLCCLARPAAATMSCTNSFSNMQFGSIDVLAGTAIYTSGVGTISCTGATPNATYQFCVSVRAGPDAAGNQRNMISGSNLLPFNLYWNSADTYPYGSYVSNYLGGGEPVTVQANGSGVVYVSGTAYYGVIPSGQQSVVPGSYTEYMAQVSSQIIQYGSLYGAGSCPTGSYSSEFSFYVYATVITNCNISTISGLTFPSSSALTSNVDTTGSISVQCTNTTPYSISLDNGAHASGSQRRMYSAAAGAYVSYNLYTDANHTDAWTATTSTMSCTAGASTCVLGTGTGSTQSAVTVYGRVPSQTTPLVGTYTDSVVVTVTY
jgi:spore coat protein U-like protein